MKQLYLCLISYMILMNGVLCDATRKIKSDDTIYFMPDESIQVQAKPLTAKEIYNYNLQMQTANKNPVQHSNSFQNTDNQGTLDMGGNVQMSISPAVQYQPQSSSNPVPVYDQYYTTKSEKRVTDQYTPYSESPVPLNIDQYTSSNFPVTTFEDKLLTQPSIISSQRVNVSAAIGGFGLNVLQIMNQQNSVLSPYSITALLALLQQGASGETQKQISRVLQMPVDVAAREYKQLTNSLKSRDVRHNILNVANGAFVSNSFRLNSNFENNAIDNFACKVTPLNFFDSYKATQTINKWVSTATNHKIDELLAPGSITASTQLVLVNTLLFKGVWQMKFRKESTLPRDFNVVGQGVKPVEFMRARRYYRYGEDKASHLQAIVLPFENQEYSLIVLLPSQKSSVAEVLRSITYAKLAEYLSYAPQDVELELPKFTVRSNADLEPLLKEMGVTNIFGSNAELHGIVNGALNPPQVSSAVHSAMLTIDEEGGTAAAATAFTVVALSYSSPDAVFKANRPFVAVLWDTKQSLPLIMAKITDPTL